MLSYKFKNGNDIAVFTSIKKTPLTTLDKFSIKIEFKSKGSIIAIKTFDIKVRKTKNQLTLLKAYFKNELEESFKIK